MNKWEAKLVKALRSGEYDQCRGSLKFGSSYCCLGVLCDIYDSTQWVETPHYPSYYQNKCDILSRNMANIIEWKTQNGLCSFRDREGNEVLLTTLNDGGLTFDQIADIIEAGLVLHIEEE